MINWLLEQTIIMTPLVLMFVVIQPWLVKILTARLVYFCWLIFPLSLVMSVIDMGAFIVLSDAFSMTQPTLLNYQQQLLAYNHEISQNTQLILFIWLTGFLGLGIGSIIRHKRFIRSLGLKRCNQLEKLLPPGINAYSSPRATTPFSAGLFSHYVVIPKGFFNDYSKQQQKLIIAHELRHITRGDLYWNVLLILIKCLFWFNPVLWWAHKYFHLCQEMACDEAVLADQNKYQKVNYSNALLAAHSSQCPRKNEEHPISTAFSDKDMCLGRLTQIMQFTPKHKILLLPPALVLVSASVTMQASVSMLENGMNELVKPIMRILPSYPENAVSENIEGFAIASFSIGEDGQTNNIQISESLPEGAFDSAVREAIKTWQYTQPYSDIDNIKVQIDFKVGDKEGISRDNPNIEGIVVTPASYSPR